MNRTQSGRHAVVKRIFWTIVALVVVLAAYLVLWPVPIRAVGWVSPSAPGYTGPHAASSKLAGLTLISLGDEAGRSTSCSLATASSTRRWRAATSCE
jgi:hypothetical protein